MGISQITYIFDYDHKFTVIFLKLQMLSGVSLFSLFIYKKVKLCYILKPSKEKKTVGKFNRNVKHAQMFRDTHYTSFCSLK